MYRDRIPAYTYDLPCGTDHAFRSLSPSVADDDDGFHWFWCRTCDAAIGVDPVGLIEHRPQAPGPRARVWGDGELVRHMDKAILKDRVAPELRRLWNTVPAAVIARRLCVPVHLVRSVADDMGVYASPLF